MTNEEFLALVEIRYDALQKLNKLDNFYDYEKIFVEVWRDLGQEVLENSKARLVFQSRQMGEMPP